MAPLSHPATAQNWTFDENNRQAYGYVLNLQPEQALKIIAQPNTIQEHYIVSLAEATELLLTEDTDKFREYETNFKSRVQKKIKGSEQDLHFFRAEALLQWTFIYLKFGHEFDAAASMREAFRIASDLRENYPRFLPVRKTTGLLNVLIGSVPQKYYWLLSLLGMHGSTAEGLRELADIKNSTSTISLEADFIYSLVHGLVLQKPDSALLGLRNILEKKPNNRLALLMTAALEIKNSQSERALQRLTILTDSTEGLPLHYANYLKGEVFLQKSAYVNGIASYRDFLIHYNGQNYVKDGYYKIALCHWLSGDTTKAITLFEEARTKGRENAEADKAAARSLAEKEPPNIHLCRVRYFTDGGYYQQAETLLNSISSLDVKSKRSKVEYYYRRARLAHKMNNVAAAKFFYKQVIEVSNNEDWYFAPNSCLQMGQILELEGNKTEAIRFYEKALQYDRHEYKNSIDAKAQLALNRLR